MRLIASFLAVFLFNNSIAQYNAINLLLKDSTQKTLFINTGNELKIQGPKKSGLILISSQHSTIHKLNDSIFIVRPTTKKADTLILLSNKKELYRGIYNIENDPEYILALGTLKEGLATKEEIIANSRFRFYTPNCNCPSTGYVGYFKVNFKSANLNPGETFFKVEGNKLTVDVISSIRKLSRNDQIVFEDIIILESGGVPRNIDKFIITIN